MESVRGLARKYQKAYQFEHGYRGGAYSEGVGGEAFVILLDNLGTHPVSPMDGDHDRSVSNIPFLKSVHQGGARRPLTSLRTLQND
jgi:hypothetical protein